METIFIKDLSNDQIGQQITRLSIMGDMELPLAPAEVVELYRNRFGLWDAEVIPNSFNDWLTGKMEDIFRVKTMTIKFLCDVTARHIEINRHRLKRYSPPALPPPPTPPEELERLHQNSRAECIKNFLHAYHHGKSQKLSRWLMQIVWDELVKRGEVEDKYSERQICDMNDFLEENDAKARKDLVNGLEGNKRAFYEKTFKDLESKTMNPHKARASACLGLWILETQKSTELQS